MCAQIDHMTFSMTWIKKKSICTTRSVRLIISHGFKNLIGHLLIHQWIYGSPTISCTILKAQKDKEQIIYAA